MGMCVRGETSPGACEKLRLTWVRVLKIAGQCHKTRALTHTAHPITAPSTRVPLKKPRRWAWLAHASHMIGRKNCTLFTGLSANSYVSLIALFFD